MNALASQAQPQTEVTLRSLAKRALLACKGNVQEATGHLLTLLRQDQALFTALANELIERACFDEVSDLNREARRTTWSADPNNDQRGSRVLALAAGNSEMLMQFRLRNGKPLGKATGNEVRATAEFYLSMSADTGHKGRWLSLIADKVGPRQLVENALGEEDLRKLKGKTDHD